MHLGHSWGVTLTQLMIIGKKFHVWGSTHMLAHQPTALDDTRIIRKASKLIFGINLDHNKNENAQHVSKISHLKHNMSTRPTT